ncbi:MAG: HesA/MoeB/ThiF family protein [Chloroflexi bacterium]|nr:HesA/MoeB/ThiF family protein [Chloroflexota bacterium]
MAVLPVRDAERLAAAFCCSLAEVELAALAEHIAPARYERNLGTIGWEGQTRLLRASVAVAGAGGLGGWVVEGLVRMGVGRLTVVDGDVFADNNLNRQLGCDSNTLGRPKAAVLAERAAAVNPAVLVTPRVCWLTAENAAGLLAEADVVVDALDSLPARAILQRAAQSLGMPLVHGAIAGNTGQVMTILPGDAGLFALYGERAALPQQGIERQLGNPAATPMLVAAWQLHEVVKLLCGSGSLLRNRLLVIDAEFGEFTEIQLAP